MPSTKTLHSVSQAAVMAAAKQVVRMAGLSTDHGHRHHVSVLYRFT